MGVAVSGHTGDNTPGGLTSVSVILALVTLSRTLLKVIRSSRVLALITYHVLLLLPYFCSNILV